MRPEAQVSFGGVSETWENREAEEQEECLQDSFREPGRLFLLFRWFDRLEHHEEQHIIDALQRATNDEGPAKG